MAKFVSVWTQKGGVAKTTLTTMLAAHYNWNGYDVKAIDVDRQQSLSKIRDLDTRVLESDEEVQQAFLSKQVLPYEIISITLTELGSILGELKKDTDPDKIIFIDMPGTIDAAGISSVCQHLDAIIVPFENDPVTFAASMETLELFRGFEQQKRRTIQKFMLWVKYIKSERQQMYDQIEKIVGQEGDVEIFSYRFPHSVSWKRERSSLIPSERITPLVEELSQKLGLEATQ
jgi:chromosome partitioning protein